LGIGCITITDHDSISGAQQMAAQAPAGLEVIVGEEISTRDGHLIGLFLEEFIEPGQSPRATAEAIKSQGGLVVVPHPFNRAFSCGLRDAVYDILDLIDAVEVFNAQNVVDSPNRRAAQFAFDHGFAPIVGSDIHHGRNLDACYQYLRPFDGPTSFLQSLRQASFVKRRHTFAYFAYTAWFVLWTKPGIGTLPGFGVNCERHREKFSPQATA
jgi:hypothetical protein